MVVNEVIDLVKKTGRSAVGLAEGFAGLMRSAVEKISLRDLVLDRREL
jgi:6-phosphofructokinase